jgi:hypothetical protein
MSAAMAVDSDPDGNGTAPAIETAADGSGNLTVKITSLGIFKYTLTVTPAGNRHVARDVTVDCEREFTVKSFTADGSGAGSGASPGAGGGSAAAS